MLAILLLTLTGCAEFRAGQSAVATHGAEAADAELEVSEWGICRAATVGAWLRRYGSDPAKANAWRQLCGTQIMTTPAEPGP